METVEIITIAAVLWLAVRTARLLWLRHQADRRNRDALERVVRDLDRPDSVYTRLARRG